MLPQREASSATLTSNTATVELGPSLPMGVYTCQETWHPDRIGALAIYCSDGRWGEAFDEFCHKCLLIPRYDRWAVPGGPAALAGSCVARDGDRAGRQDLDFLVRVHELERIALITHYGCAYYGELLQRPADDCISAQTHDLHAAAHSLRDWFPTIRVEGYFAMRKGRCLSFHQVDL